MKTKLNRTISRIVLWLMFFTIINNYGNAQVKSDSSICDAYFLVGGGPFYAGDLIRFDDYSWSNGSITTWAWNFGDSSYSSIQSPYHVYQLPGDYNVCLEITSYDSLSNLCVDSYCWSLHIEDLTANCVANFSVDSSLMTVNSPIQFIDQSTSNYTIMAWHWTFGDGGTSNQQNPVYYYPTAGTYNACLTIFTDDSCSSTFCQNVVINNQGSSCQAGFTTDSSLMTVNSPIQFIDLSTSNYTIMSWHWTFGDGGTSNQQNPVYYYPSAGTYNVCLTIFTDDSCSSTFCQNVVINNQGSSCQAGFTTDSSLMTVNSPIQFIDLSTSNYTIMSWHWTFGDGGTLNQQNPVYYYPSAGTYNVCLTIFTDDSCSSTFCQNVVISNQSGDCQASFSIDSSNLVLNSPIYFINQSLGNIYSYYWTFGDGSYAQVKNPTHTYSSAGWYNVCLTVYGADSCVNTYCDSIFISGNISSCQADFTWALAYCGPNCVGFFDQSTSNSTILNWYWTFGDGSVSDLPNPTHHYSLPGQYNVCLTIFTADSCINSYCENISVITSDTACIANFSYRVDSLNSNTYYFINNSSFNGWFSNPVYLWNFDDGTNSSEENPNHFFTPGSYNVCLTISVNGVNSSCTHTFCQNIQVGISGDFYNLGGHVFAGNYPINSGLAMLFRVYGNDINYVHTTLLDSIGYFYFHQIAQGAYKVWAMPTDQNMFLYAPTYYGNTLFWSDASVINLNQNIWDANINLINILGNTGQGIISGKIANSAQNARIKSLADIEVLLLDENNSPKAVAYTDAGGNFSFQNLAYETYMVYAEYAGYQCIPVEVILNSSNPAVNSVQLVINNNITGTVEYGFVQSDLGEIYPSPASYSKNINTILRLKQDADVSIKMVDISGKVVFTMKELLKKGVHTLTIPVDNIGEGLYFLNVVTSDGKVNAMKKFIK